MYLVSFVLLALLPAGYCQLNTLAVRAGKRYFGTATDNPELTDSLYVAQLGNTSDFNQITAVSIPSRPNASRYLINFTGKQYEMGATVLIYSSESPFEVRLHSQDATEPSRGTFTFSNGDVVANLAHSHGQLLRGL